MERTSGIGKVKGTFRVGSECTIAILEREWMLVAASIVGLCLLAYSQIVVKIPITIVFASSIPIICLSILIWRMMLFTTGVELAILRPVMIGSAEEFGYMDTVLVVLKLKDLRMVLSCMSHMNHILGLTRKNPESNTWTVLLEQTNRLEQGEIGYEQFEEMLDQMRLLHRSVGTH